MGSNESNKGSSGSLISSSSLLGNTLFSKGRRKILTLFFLHPDRQFYYREIIRITYSTPGPIQRELRLLAEAGILQVEKIGIQKFYRANRACPIFEELRRIVQKTFGIVDVLGEALRPHRDRISLALIYGSVASGEDTAESDVDLLVVGQLSFRDLTVILKGVEETLHRPVNSTLYSVEQFAREQAANNHFIRSVLESPAIYLIGAKDATGRLA